MYSYLMQIIFDEKLVPSMRERHTVLELDTIMQDGLAAPITLYAVIEHVPILEMAELENLKELHAQLIGHYKMGDWHLVPHAVEPLMGKFNGELDSFYQEVLDFSSKCAKLNKKWDGIRYTTPV
jgi:hypothetical protein